ncbi:proton-coupled amino acid transporter-like protein pathetic isoform X2 [Toxorhynchites rutilus septentrionalis]|nr:proton-coupled amino acid transporter-like protein pathetic isoform X2 [Toxorhynchites rutilus septentrionalis]XP_055617907.1 proton-coupled amino acid transporter-like protein pathetic isoform X2 [Toxorhynchites rutilus septentrionalis]
MTVAIPLDERPRNESHIPSAEGVVNNGYVQDTTNGKKHTDHESVHHHHGHDHHYHLRHHHVREKPGHDYTEDVITTHGIQAHHKTSYLETMTHMLKGNIGTGCYAMGDAFKNGGLVLAPILTVFLGFICVHCQHVLLNCASKVHLDQQNKGRPPDFAETVGLVFETGPPKVQRWASTMKLAVNIFICVTQLGFCCIYFVFIGSNFKQIFDRYDMKLDVHYHMALLLIPIILTAIITKLKFLSYCSMLANIFMSLGIGITFYYASQDLPSPSERNYVASWNQLPLFFGTAIFAFEGIALVLPLQNEMKKPEDFSKTFGVLNLGMVFIVTLFTAFGFVGYLKWGEAVEGSMTLNLPEDEMLAESVKVMISLGVLLGFALQFFVAIIIMWPTVECQLNITKHKVLAEMGFRVVMVLVTFAIAECVPKLSLFISLIGALCSTALALVFPPIIELIVAFNDAEQKPGLFLIAKNVFILMLAVIGFTTGSYESISKIVQELL